MEIPEIGTVISTQEEQMCDAEHDHDEDQPCCNSECLRLV
jgi:hypothetical protein